MHRIFPGRAGFCAVLLGVFIACPLGAEPAGGPDGALTVMTFNLKYASTNRPNAWTQRRPVMRECIERVAPDVMGTQEGVYGQLKDLAADLPAYGWIGLGRDGGSRGEFMAVFYRTQRLEPLEFDHFWLSDTPSVIGSSTWGATHRRMVTWVKFLDRQTQQPFFFYNTHLDHQVQAAREKGAALIRQRLEAIRADLPVILTGDFNAIAGANKAYDILTGDGFLVDTWKSAGERRQEEYNSFHNYDAPKKDGLRIDWILTRATTQTAWEEIVIFNQDGQYPSDHFPVAARMRLGLGKP